MKKLERTDKLLRSFPGDIPVVVKVEETGKVMKAARDSFASDDEILLDGLKMLLGDGNVVMRYKTVNPSDKIN